MKGTALSTNFGRHNWPIKIIQQKKGRRDGEGEKGRTDSRAGGEVGQCEQAVYLGQRAHRRKPLLVELIKHSQEFLQQVRLDIYGGRNALMRK